MTQKKKASVLSIHFLRNVCTLMVLTFPTTHLLLIFKYFAVSTSEISLNDRECGYKLSDNKNKNIDVFDLDVASLRGLKRSEERV